MKKQNRTRGFKLTVWLTEEEKEFIKSKAKENDKTIADLILSLLK